MYFCIRCNENHSSSPELVFVSGFKSFEDQIIPVGYCSNLQQEHSNKIELTNN